MTAYPPDQARWLARLRDSEQRLASVIGVYREGAEFRVLRSDSFPQFYAGNCLTARTGASDRSLDAWVALFRSEFPADRYRHITLVFPDGTANPSLLAEAASRGFHVIPEVLMACSAQSLAAQDAPPPAAAMRALANDDDMRELYEMHLAEARGEDWFVDDGDFAALFRKTMMMSRAVSMSWLTARLPTTDRGLDAALGYFDEGELCRLQEVMTAPRARSRGLATLLIRQVAARAVMRDREAIGLFAEADGDGHRLYLNLGFRELARDTTLMAY